MVHLHQNVESSAAEVVVNLVNLLAGYLLVVSHVMSCHVIGSERHTILRRT